MLLSCEFVFDEITNESVKAMNTEKVELLSNYMFNGGDLTLAYLRELNKTSPETVSDILDYLHDAPLYEAITVGENDFLLVHAGVGDFSTDKKISDYSSHDLIWSRPRLDEDYYDDIITVLGHIPTMHYSSMYKGKTIKTKTWINIDVGAGFGQEPVLLRLEDFKKFRF